MKIMKGMTRAGLYRHFASLGFNKGAEIGVQEGLNAAVMFQNIPNLELTLVDPYKNYPYTEINKGHEKHKKTAFKRLNGKNVRWLYGPSDRMSYEVPDQSLDFVYIDGNHSYAFVMTDLIMWHRKVRKNGVISGHDYGYHKPNGFGVFKAVRHFSKAYKVKQIYVTDITVDENKGDRWASFFFRKP